MIKLMKLKRKKKLFFFFWVFGIYVFYVFLWERVRKKLETLISTFFILLRKIRIKPRIKTKLIIKFIYKNKR